MRANLFLGSCIRSPNMQPNDVMTFHMLSEKFIDLPLHVFPRPNEAAYDAACFLSHVIIWIIQEVRDRKRFSFQNRMVPKVG